MISTSQALKQKNSNIDWTIIAFFVMAYVIAWTSFCIIALIAKQSGIENPQRLIAMGETWQYQNVTVSTPHWFIYVLTRFADFAFSIAGIIMIAVTAGRSGLRQLWQRLTRWQFSWIWYVIGLLPLLLYGVSAIFSGALSSANVSINTIGTILFSLQAGFFVSLFLRGAFGEEFGLRGFALPRLQERMSSFRASLINWDIVGNMALTRSHWERYGICCGVLPTRHWIELHLYVAIQWKRWVAYSCVIVSCDTKLGRRF